ncbi:MAG: amino acid ABC transporter permease [Alphaproteobacteria bacterium]|nr:amino acid ABC transporter permease [Alphaproteobacteria bacterium]
MSAQNGGLEEGFTEPGIAGWLRANLFSSVGNSVLTVLGAVVAGWLIWTAVDWAILTAVFTGSDGAACRVPGAGACWPFVTNKLQVFMYGRYPAEEIWRVNLTYVLALAGLIPLMMPGVPGKLWISVYLLVAFPVLAYFLLTGAEWLGMVNVETDRWGGLLVTLVVACVGIAASFPIGIVLALARRSELPLIKWLAVFFIEFVRGVPLVTVLFFSSVMLPLFLPENVTFDKLLRALIGVALFSSAYMAEVVRGGLQAVPRGQFEAADALGLSYPHKMGLIVLPQALKLVIPSIVNSFIALFKDTSLVLIIGLFDLLGIVQSAVASDAKWFSPQTAATGYVFAAFVFWIFCFGMSRYSAALEDRLNVGHRD